MIKSLKGLITLSEEILCEAEVLGQVFDAEIAGISTRIYFPGCPEIKTAYPGFLHSNYLIPPEIGKRWKRGNEQLCWGYIVQYPSCINLVEQLAISVEYDDAQSNSISSELYEAIDEWEHSFVTYLRLETKFGTG